MSIFSEQFQHAEYQTAKIRKAITQGLERRPKRAASAQGFLDNVLPRMEEAIASKDTAAFDSDFRRLTTSCNRCHEAEKVPFFYVGIPTSRRSPIRARP